MEDSPLMSLTTTEGVLVGHELAEWAGFTSGRIFVEKKDGTRFEFRFGKDSRGIVPKIGSIVSVQHSLGICPEIIKIDFVEKIELYKGTNSLLDSLLMGRSTGVAMIVLAAMGGGLTMILFGLLTGGRTPFSLVVFGLCGVSYIIIGYLVWVFTGE